jgi:hypothetical protein
VSRESAASAFEIYDGDFKQLARPARYWETQHPLGLTGLARLSVAVESDADGVLAINPAQNKNLLLEFTE